MHGIRVVSWCVVSCRVASRRVICHVMSYIMSCYISYVMSCHISCHVIYHVICHVMSYIISYHMISYHITSHHIPYHIIYYIILYYTILYYIISFILYYTILNYIILYSVLCSGLNSILLRTPVIRYNLWFIFCVTQTRIFGVINLNMYQHLHCKESLLCIQKANDLTDHIIVLATWLLFTFFNLANNPFFDKTKLLFEHSKADFRHTIRIKHNFVACITLQ